jgi:hypothetical protein
MKPRRAKSTYFLLAVLTTNIFGCIWYLCTPPDAEFNDTATDFTTTLPKLIKKGVVPQEDDKEADNDYGVGQLVTFTYINKLPESK